MIPLHAIAGFQSPIFLTLKVIDGTFEPIDGSQKAIDGVPESIDPIPSAIPSPSESHRWHIEPRV